VAMVWLLQLPDLQSYCLLGLLLFILCSKVVLEQYLMWPVPLLILEAAAWPGLRRTASLALLGVLSTVGMVANPYVHPFGPAPMPLAIVLAAAILGYVVLVVAQTAQAPADANAASRMSSPSVSNSSPITSGGRNRSTLP
jgi:hypothetical protein